jgi:hypothetical protein
VRYALALIACWSSAGCDKLFDLQPIAVPSGADGSAVTDGSGSVGIDAPSDSRVDAVPVGAQCPTSYAAVSTVGVYRFETSNVTSWLSAENSCVADQVIGSTKHTHLAVITTETERSMVHAVVPQGILWVGLSDRVVEGAFQWVSSEPAMGYPPASGTPWASGQPSATDPLDDCVIMNVQADFDDVLCNGTTRAYICECDDYVLDPAH